MDLDDDVRIHALPDDDDEFEQEEQGEAKEAQGQADKPDKPKPAKKRVQKARPKLTLELLKGDKGLSDPFHTFPAVFRARFKGRGHEVSDLQTLLEMYVRWQQRLFNHCSFDDFISRLEKLGSTNVVKNELRQLRANLVQLLRDDEDGARADKDQGHDMLLPVTQAPGADAQRPVTQAARAAGHMAAGTPAVPPTAGPTTTTTAMHTDVDDFEFEIEEDEELERQRRQYEEAEAAAGIDDWDDDVEAAAPPPPRAPPPPAAQPPATAAPRPSPAQAAAAAVGGRQGVEPLPHVPRTGSAPHAAPRPGLHRLGHASQSAEAAAGTQGTAMGMEGLEDDGLEDGEAGLVGGGAGTGMDGSIPQSQLVRGRNMRAVFMDSDDE